MHLFPRFAALVVLLLALAAPIAAAQDAAPGQKGQSDHGQGNARGRQPDPTPTPTPTATATPTATPVDDHPGKGTPNANAAPHATPVPTAVATPAVVATSAQPTVKPAAPVSVASHSQRVAIRGGTATVVLPQLEAARTLPRASATPAPTAAPARTPAPQRHSAEPAATPRASDPAPRAPQHPSTLTRTFTRVVEVLPGWVQALVGLLALVAVVAAVVLLRARRLERQRRRLAEDVGLLQSVLLPALPETIGSAFVSAAYKPADGPAAGGDFYDAFELPGGRTGVVVGDIEGHGRSALPLTALVRYTLRSHLENGLEPRFALQMADAVLFNQLRGRLVTAVAGVYDPLTGHLTYACAGHPQPLLLGLDQPRASAATSPPIGSGTTTGRRQVTTSLPPGTAACFYTDGLADLRASRDAERLGFEALAGRIRALGPESDADAVLTTISRRQLQGDDMTVCILRPAADATSPPLDRLEELELRGSDLDLVHSFVAESGADADALSSVLAAARRAIAESGAAVLEAHSHDGGAPSIEVRRPEFVAFPGGMRRADEPAAFADAV